MTLKNSMNLQILFLWYITTSTILSYYCKCLNILEVVPKLQPTIISNDR